jgi:signal transduction histidine kinase
LRKSAAELDFPRMPEVGPRALVVTPNRGDADLALGFLAESGIPAVAYAGLNELGGAVTEQTGCLLLVEECLIEYDLAAFRDSLERQPPWSDMPLILVASAGAGLGSLIERTFPNSGNITLLERPLNPVTLVSAVQVGLRARARQLEVRDLLAKRDEALRHRDEFLAMLAHELRNPLAPMRNAIYIQQRVAGNDPALLAKTRDILDRQIKHLSRMVDDLLDIARLERGKVQLQVQRLDLNACVTAAIDACLPIIQRSGHHLQMNLASEPLHLDADPVRLEQLLTNLIVNAAKFTPNGGEIALHTARQGSSAVASVRDNGIGIRAEMLESVFQPFTQDDRSLARSSGGLGIGLSIARRVAELHGGRLTASSEGTGKGARFEVRLPLSARSETPRAEPGVRVSPRRRRVLVVEDNADIRESFRMILEMWGHEVTMAGSGQEGLELASSARPDVALIDIGLPGMSGYELANAIRGRSEHWPSRMTLIAVTGYGQPADRERALDSGFDAHLLKPVNPLELEELLYK